MTTYHFKNQITHHDIIVADKVNFFADYFEFTLINYGRPNFVNLENHKSLLEKIKFQLDNYSIHSQQYIKHYFKNNYLTKKDWLIKEYYSEEWQKINTIKQDVLTDFSNSTKRDELNKEITKFLKKLDETLFENALNNIISAILCKHPLHKHNHIAIFQYHTPIILCEFIFSGFPKKDLQKLFDKILSKEVELSNNKVRTDAPLPQSLLELKQNPENKSEIFYNAASDYLKNRTLKQQFEGIYYLFKNSLKDKTYLFRLANVNAFRPVSLNYNGVIFSNQFRKKYVTRGSTRKEYREFFNGKGKLFAQVTIKENNDDVGKTNATLKINNALNYLNTILEKEARIELDDFIIKDDDNNVRHTSWTKIIHPEDAVKFDEYNAYQILNKKGNSLTEKYLKLDPIYFQALNSDLKEIKIVTYWRFMEAFFEAEDFKSEAIKKTVSKILSQNSISDFALNYFNLACQVLNTAYFRPIKSVHDKSGINHFLNITDEELRTLLHPKLISNINFKRLKEVINQPYIAKQMEWFLSTSKEEKIKVAHNFYINVLTETYEQRNFIEHSGIHNEKSIDKILLTLPKLVKDFRRLIITELKKDKHKSFGEIITSLSVDSKN
jgi:hypothetical protein